MADARPLVERLQSVAAAFAGTPGKNVFGSGVATDLRDLLLDAQARITALEQALRDCEPLHLLQKRREHIEAALKGTST